MSTTKTIKIQKNKILTYGINKTGFQTVNKTLVVTEDTTINEELVATSNTGILNLGDRIFDCATFVDYFTPSGEYDIDSLKYITASQTTGTGLTNIQINKGLWLAQIETILSIETPKGTSKSFVFTYNGSSWDLTGAVTVSGISATDLGDIYGISFTGTPTSGNVITVVETQYNKFAVYVLDSNYRSNQQAWGPETLTMPKQYSSAPQNCIESATFYNKYILDYKDISQYAQFNYCRNLGNFILPNGIKINAVVPNGAELKAIWDNRIFLDSCDPIIQAGGTNCNLTNWAFYNGWCYSCIEWNGSYTWYMTSGGSFESGYDGYINKKFYGKGCCPVFEVPVM